jgi:hypothetical protein
MNASSEQVTGRGRMWERTSMDGRISIDVVVPRYIDAVFLMAEKEPRCEPHGIDT